ncbi:expressed unknown protein [Seminavis robusta]|uniref:Uncharacterized protein n=1 Tax=Seminavis robusta TaxID=568900 RepID=A0A9N8E0W7_9STRA|nr:expressed unknown protein [Seminavis robusta]|eukprot:Sro537_g162350.1 n/a (495) ;mRNA; f:31175-32745
MVSSEAFAPNDAPTTTPKMGDLKAAEDPAQVTTQGSGRCCRLELEDIPDALAQPGKQSLEDADTEHTETPSSCDSSDGFSGGANEDDGFDHSSPTAASEQDQPEVLQQEQETYDSWQLESSALEESLDVSEGPTKQVPQELATSEDQEGLVSEEPTEEVRQLPNTQPGGPEESLPSTPEPSSQSVDVDVDEVAGVDVDELMDQAVEPDLTAGHVEEPPIADEDLDSGSQSVAVDVEDLVPMAPGEETKPVGNQGEKSATGRRVSFSKIEIREYPRCLGDHPCVVVGPPLSIGWNPSGRYELDLDEYEQSREYDIRAAAAASIAAAEARKAAALGEEKVDEEKLARLLEEKLRRRPTKRRTPMQYNISVRKRIEILQEECSKHNEEAEANGTLCSGAEIKARIREMQKIKIQRIRSAYMKDFEGIFMIRETLQLKLQKVWRKARKSRAEADQEKQMLLAACGSYISESEKRAPKMDRRSSLKAIKAPKENIDGIL